MPALPRIRGLFLTLFRRAELEHDLDRELQCTLDLLTEEKVRAGSSPQQARREAWIELEGVEQVKDRVREERHGSTLDSLLGDVRYSLRTLRRNPGFAGVAVATLALGIGATTALFSTLNAILLQDLPYREPARLVAGTKTVDGRTAGPVSQVDYFDVREQGRAFTDLALVSNGAGRVAVTGDGKPELVGAAQATWNLFRTLGAEPVAGRSFLPEDEARNDAAVALISFGLWQRRFAGAPSAVGSILHLDSSPVTVVGVLPRGFRFLHDADIWLPVQRGGSDSARDMHSHILIGRLAAGVSAEQAQSEVDAIAARLAQQFPDTNKGKGLLLWDLHRYMVRQARPGTLLLMATAGLVLLIACGNVAGLLLARGQRRLSEMAMRAALGATQRRLIRQLLTESVILTALAGAAGVGVAFLVQRSLLLRLLPAGSPGVPPPTVDGVALLFALCVSIVTGLLVGIVPALRGAGTQLASRLRSGPRASEGVHGARMRSALVVVQVALSILLLVGSGLLARSLQNLASVKLGFEPTGVLTAGVRIQTADHPTPGQRIQLFASLLDEIEALPGVTSAGAVSKLPIASTATDWPIWPAHQPRPSNGDATMALARWATPGYFTAMGMPLLAGRDIGAGDLPGSTPVVVVTEAVARGLFPSQSPIGQRVRLGWTEDSFEVVGVVGNARINGLRSEFDEAMYLSAAQTDGSGLGFQLAVTALTLTVRTGVDPFLLADPIRKILERKDPNAVLGTPTSMTSIIDNDLSGSRTLLAAVGLLSAVALLLTAVGLYGVLAYQVSQRRNELGIRMAIGATSLSLIGMVMKQGATLVGSGLAAGLLAALPASFLLRQLLFGIGPLDPRTYLVAAVSLALVGGMACFVPAWRATRVSLVEVLRRD